ncbi:putative papain-like cysteine peptidase superfamily [Arabidopsis thaliana]
MLNQRCSARINMRKRDIYVCYGNSIAEALEHIEREGIPKEIPQFRQYKCRRYPPSAHKRKHKIKSVLSFDTLDKALAHLHIQPVGAALITFPELWRIGEHIYRGPLEENTQFTGFHDVVIVKVDVINREQVALCKLSNGPKVGVGGYVWVSLEVMYMVVGAQDNDKDMLRPSSTPRHLLSDFNCPLMDEAPRANLKRKQEQQDEPKRSKKRRRQRVARSSSKLHSNLDDDDVASLHGQVRQLINTRDTDSHNQEASHEDDKPAVVTSDNLPISTEECSQLSFGSSPLSNNAGETSDVASKMEHSDARSTDFYGHSMGSSNSHNALSLGGPSSSMPEDG